jgi:hypothetical protein
MSAAEISRVKMMQEEQKVVHGTKEVARTQGGKIAKLQKSMEQILKQLKHMAKPGMSKENLGSFGELEESGRSQWHLSQT